MKPTNSFIKYAEEQNRESEIKMEENYKRVTEANKELNRGMS